MISLDVVSLFTNLPKELIMDAINKRWSDIAQHTDLSREEFIEMVHRILNQTYFIFDGTIYSQIDGMPMGSPFSPIAAEITMDVLLDTVVEWVQLTMDITLTVVKKYVDDLYLIVPETCVLEIIAIFNSANIDVQFTYEMEKDFCLNYLDMTIIRDPIDGTITTK